jgi:hypothetical protein
MGNGNQRMTSPALQQPVLAEPGAIAGRSVEQIDSRNGKRPGGWLRKLHRKEQIISELQALIAAKEEKEVAMLALIAKQQQLLARLGNKIKAMEAQGGN